MRTPDDTDHRTPGGSCVAVRDREVTAAGSACLCGEEGGVTVTGCRVGTWDDVACRGREFSTAAAAASWPSFFPHAAGPALSSPLLCLSAHAYRWHGSLLPLHTGMVAEPIHWLVIHLSDHTVRCFAMLACSALLRLRIGQDAGSAEEILLIYFWFR